ncbi:hypothetical protein PHMEG_00012601 [Phytophthora megakarya]|uniref:MULE transposase domain-containing protein n=1 Tax=Phytophthora megakarya TaxID=4795 RepID=A0A225W8C6_9STRA|nr:hypothetical protein PHMEG_00012601 [Phytophthora megakarya]
MSETILEDVDRLAAESNLTQTNIWAHIVENCYMQTGPPVCGVSKTAVENRYAWHDDVKAQKDSVGVDRILAWEHSELRNLLHCVGCKLTPKEIVCAFEGALIGVIREFFPQVCIIGCWFHLKETCGRKLKRYRIPKADVKVAMAPGGFDVLSVIHTDKIDIQGIAWVKMKITAVCETKKIPYSRR